MLLSQAQCSIEGQVALVRGVNAELSSTLRRLRTGATGDQQQLQQQHVAAQQLAQDVRRLHALGSLPAGAWAPSQDSTTSTQGSSRLQQQQQLQQQRSRQPVARSFHTSQPGQPSQGSTASRTGPPQLQHPGMQAAHSECSSSGGSTGLPLQLPPNFQQLLAEYSSLQEQMGSNTQPHGPAAAGMAGKAFTQQLELAYGPSLQAAQQQHQHQHQQPSTEQALRQWLDPGTFAAQANFLGLVSAALWAFQKLKALASSHPTTTVGNAEQQHLEQVVPALLSRCQQWLAGAALRQQQAAVQQTGSIREEDAVRWRNRCLRSLLSGGAAGAPARQATTSSGVAALLPPPGIWLPEDCWRPLAPGSSTCAWQSLLPSRHALSSSICTVAAMPAAAAAAVQQQQPMVLSYMHLDDTVQHSRQLQKLQQLLLQLAVETRAAPSLLELLLRGCVEASHTAAAAGSRAGPLAPHAGFTQERCCALYRLLYGLAAGPVKQRGLGSSCQLAEEVQVAAAALIDWD